MLGMQPCIAKIEPAVQTGSSMCPLSRRASRSPGAYPWFKAKTFCKRPRSFSAAASEYLELKLANRHGLVTGATGTGTGTGKTVSLQVLAEGFADAGVPVFGVPPRRPEAIAWF
jgi:hypothetical protein